MTALAAPAELATYLQTATQDEANSGSTNILDTVIAQQALDFASAKIRAAAGWQIAPPVTITHTVEWGDRLFLPSQRVADVVVTVNGVAPVEGSWVFTDAGVISFNPYWSPVYTGWSRLVTITYSSGFAEVPDAVKGLCLEVAAGIYSNPGSLLSTTYGNVTEVFRPPATAANPEDLRVDSRLAPYVVMAFA